MPEVMVDMIAALAGQSEALESGLEILGGLQEVRLDDRWCAWVGRPQLDEAAAARQRSGQNVLSALSRPLFRAGDPTRRALGIP